MTIRIDRDELLALVARDYTNAQLAEHFGVPLAWFYEPGPPRLTGIACMRGRGARSLRLYDVPRLGGGLLS